VEPLVLTDLIFRGDEDSRRYLRGCV